MHAVKKTGLSWSTRRAKGILAATFHDQKLDLDSDPKFSISKYFDFFIIDNNILITNKSNFESVLSYKMAHARAFVGLKNEKEFIQLFSDVTKINEYVGKIKSNFEELLQFRRRVIIKTLNL